jgi:hypothetical protein
MKRSTALITIVVIAAICFALGYMARAINSTREENAATEIVRTDTISVRDTLYICTPQFLDTKRTGTLIAKLPVYTSSEISKQPSADATNETDADSIAVLIPIEQRHYVDTCYEAWVSGYSSSLDSLRIYSTTKEIQTTVTTKKYATSRWGLSLGLGIVATSTNVTPGIFIGATYTFLSF